MTLVPNARYFDGHFEGAPILPGVAHIALAIEACADRGVCTSPLTGLRDVRFTRPLGPADPIDILLAAGREPATVKFEIRSGDQIATTGTLVFTAGQSRGDAPDHK